MFREGPLFIASPPILVVFGLFDLCHSHLCEVIYNCYFDLYFPYNKSDKYFFMYLLTFNISSFGKESIQLFYSLYDEVIVFSVVAICKSFT